jgi:hypothetical protein
VSRFAAALAIALIINAVFWLQINGGAVTLTADLLTSQGSAMPLYRTITWWVARAYLNEKTPPDVVLMGSSQMDAAAWGADMHVLHEPIDCVLHRQVISLDKKLSENYARPVKVLNCAIQGAVASDYYMLARALFTGTHKPKLVVVGISPRDFIDNQLASASSTEPFRFFYQYVDAGKLSAIAFPDPLGRMMGELEWATNRLPLRRIHAWLEEQMLAMQQAQPATKSKPQESGVMEALAGSAFTVKPGQLVVKDNMTGFWTDNTKEYAKRYRVTNPPSYKIQLSFFGEFLSLLKQENVDVLVVGMPTLPSNRALLPAAFWNSYRQQISLSCREHGASWLDISDNDDYRQAEYLDTVHVNDSGGDKLICAFAEAIAKRPQLAHRLDGKSEKIARKTQPISSGI